GSAVAGRDALGLLRRTRAEGRRRHCAGAGRHPSVPGLTSIAAHVRVHQMEVVDTQVHIARMVVDTIPGHARTGEQSVEPRSAPGIPLVRPGSWDAIITAT